MLQIGSEEAHYIHAALLPRMYKATQMTYTAQQDHNAVAWYIREINNFQNSGMYFYEDEIHYGQRKYDKALAAMQAVGGADVVATALEKHVPADKAIVLDEQAQAGWTPLWRIVQRYQCCTYQDLPRYEQAFGCELPAYRPEGWTEEELAEFKRADEWDVFCSEISMLQAVLMAGSEHC